MEHALCEYDKYNWSAQAVQIKERLFTDSTSHVYLDKEMTCKECQEIGAICHSQKCTLCGSAVYKPCDPGYKNRCLENSWICSTCQKIEELWVHDDYDEYNKNDLIVKTYKNGASKRDSRLRNKVKKKAQKVEAEILSRKRSMDEEDESEDEFKMFGLWHSNLK